MKQSPLKTTTTTNIKPPRQKRPIGPIQFAPSPVAGQQPFNFDFETDEEPGKDE